MNPRAAKKKGLDTKATGELLMVIEAYFMQMPPHALDNIENIINKKLKEGIIYYLIFSDRS